MYVHISTINCNYISSVVKCLCSTCMTCCTILQPSADLVPQLPAPIGAPLADVVKMFVLEGEDAPQVVATSHAALKVPGFLKQDAQFSKVPVRNGIGMP